jgi:hypothetical protein
MLGCKCENRDDNPYLKDGKEAIKNHYFERRFIMPGGDRTGPMGMGPMTGRAAGYCAGFPMPGYANPVDGRGYFGRGGGRGWRNRFYATGLPGWARAGYGWPASGSAVSPYAYGGTPFAPGITTQQELDGLKGQAEYLEDALDGIKRRIEEIESQKSSKD